MTKNSQQSIWPVERQWPENYEHYVDKKKFSLLLTAYIHENSKETYITVEDSGKPGFDLIGKKVRIETQAWIGDGREKASDETVEKALKAAEDEIKSHPSYWSL